MTIYPTRKLASTVCDLDEVVCRPKDIKPDDRQKAPFRRQLRFLRRCGQDHPVGFVVPDQTQEICRSFKSSEQSLPVSLVDEAQLARVVTELPTPEPSGYFRRVRQRIVVGDKKTACDLIRHGQVF